MALAEAIIDLLISYCLIYESIVNTAVQWRGVKYLLGNQYNAALFSFIQKWDTNFESVGYVLGILFHLLMHNYNSSQYFFLKYSQFSF